MQVLPETRTGPSHHADPYRSAFELSGVGMVLLDAASGRIVLANDSIAHLIGHEAAEMLGRSGYDVVHPDDREASRAGLAALVRGEVGPYAVERRFLHRDGRVVWLRLHISLSRDADGTPRHIIMAGEDVSERRAVEQALREGEERLRLLTDAMPALIARVGPDLRYQFVNAAYRDWFGLGPEAMVGRTVLEVMGPAVHAMVTPRMEQALAGERLSFEGPLPYPGGTRHIRADYLPSRGPDGRVNGIYTLAFDITPMARSRQEVVAVYRGYFDNTAESLFSFAITPDGGFAFEELNPAHERATGLRIAELRGKRLEEVLPAPVAAELAANYRRCLEEGRPISYEETLELPAGTRCWDTVLVPVREGDGPFTRIIGSARDITDRRRAESALARETAERQQAEHALRQAQKMEALGRLTGGVAHDFNNLLTIIQGNLEVAARRLGSGQEELAEEIGTAAGAAQRAAALTQRLLAFSRRQALAPAATDLNALLTGAEDLLRQALGEGIKVERRPAPGLWLTWCDANQVENALLNLAINARDAMPGGGRLLLETGNATLAPGECGTCPDARPGDYVRLSVADNGCGMTRDVLEQAFDPFFTTKPLGQGTGLGLSQVYGFAKQSGGFAQLHSAPGRGTIVSIFLPRHAGTVAAAPVPEEPPPAEAPGQARILVVEDEALVRLLVVKELRAAGHTVLEAGDGEVALEMLLRGPVPDLLLTDVGLPGINGRQLAEAARERHPDLRVLFMTGYAHAAALAGDALGAGTDLLPKPFSVQVLMRRVNRLLPVGVPSTLAP